MGMNWPNNETGNDSEKPKSEGYLMLDTLLLLGAEASSKFVLAELIGSW
jgi:hypothetical protein